jgi:porphyrinogen peroxidase
MAQSQAVLSPLTRAALIIVVTVDHGGEARVRDLLTALSGLQRAVGFRDADGDLSCVTGIGAYAWDRLFGVARPVDLTTIVDPDGTERAILRDNIGDLKDSRV